MSEPTKRPWHWRTDRWASSITGNALVDYLGIEGPGDEDVMSIDAWSDPLSLNISDEDAALIVKAVNHYGSLVSITRWVAKHAGLSSTVGCELGEQAKYLLAKLEETP